MTSNVRVPTEEAVEYTAPVKTVKQMKADAATPISSRTFDQKISEIQSDAPNRIC